MSRQIQRYVLRVSQILYGRVVSAAKREDISMNDWITQAVTEKLNGPVPLPSTQRPGTTSDLHVGIKPNALELAARFGITTASQLSEQVDNNSKEAIQVGNCPVEDVAPARDWRKFYIELQEMDPTEALHEFMQATQDIKLPPGFLKMPMPKQLAWLQVNGEV